MALKSVWGIDVGKYSIKAVRLDRKKNEFLVGATDIIPYRTLPLFEKDVEWEDLVFESLRDLYFRQRIGESPVMVSLTGHQIFNRVIEIATADARRLPELVKHEAKQQIPGDINEVIWEWQDISSEAAVEREVALFAMRRDVVDTFMDILRISGVQPIGLTVPPLAVTNFLGYDQPLDGPRVVLDMGSDSTELLVIHGAKVWIRPLRTTGNDFTRAIRNAAGGQLSDAEKIKRQIARHPKKDRLLQALEPLQNELVTEIQRSLGFYKQQAEEGIDFKRLLILGGGTRVPGLTRGLTRGLQMQVDALSELGRLRVGPKADANLFNANLPVLAPALGLALQGHDTATYDVNLLPRGYRAAIQREGKKGWVIAAGVVVLLAGLSHFLLFKTTQSRMQDLVTEAKEINKDLDNRGKELERALDHEDALELREFHLKAVEDRREVLDVLHRLHGLLPEANDQDYSVEVARQRRLLSSLEMLTEVKRGEIDEVDPDSADDPPATVKVPVRRRLLTTAAEVWYYANLGGPITGPANAFKQQCIEAFPDDRVEVTANAARYDSPDPAALQDANGDYVKFTITITRELAVTRVEER